MSVLPSFAISTKEPINVTGYYDILTTPFHLKYFEHNIESITGNKPIPQPLQIYDSLSLNQTTISTITTTGAWEDYIGRIYNRHNNHQCIDDILTIDNSDNDDESETMTTVTGMTKTKLTTSSNEERPIITAFFILIVVIGCWRYCDGWLQNQQEMYQRRRNRNEYTLLGDAVLQE